MSWWTSPNLHPKTKNRFVVVFSNAFYLPNIKSLNKPSVDIETKEYRLLNHTFNYPGNAKWKPVTLKFVDMNGMGRQTDFFDTSAFLWQMLNNTGYAYPHFDESIIREPMYRNVSEEGNIEGKGHHISTKVNFRDDPTTEAEEFDTWRTITTPEKSSNIANSFGLGLSGEIDMQKAGISKQRIAIYQVTPDEHVAEAWYLINPIVKSINWGDLAYEDDNLVEYELQIVYDWAILDRQAIGNRLEVNEEPYKQFMKTLQNNRSAAEREISEIADQPRQQALARLSEKIEENGRSEQGTRVTDSALDEIAADLDRSSSQNVVGTPDKRSGPSPLVTQPETGYRFAQEEDRMLEEYRERKRTQEITEQQEYNEFVEKLDRIEDLEIEELKTYIQETDEQDREELFRETDTTYETD